MTYNPRRPFLSLIIGMDRLAVGMSQRVCPTPSVPRIEERIPGMVFVHATRKNFGSNSAILRKQIMTPMNKGSKGIVTFGEKLKIAVMPRNPITQLAKGIGSHPATRSGCDMAWSIRGMVESSSTLCARGYFK
ncbi:hypothetical protein [Yoonia sp. R2-816]|uniref:hypothetical protein n=1 Tax=Yoonia sp. R2-816 TaxID=3342638 RepID=UPI003728102B